MLFWLLLFTQRYGCPFWHENRKIPPRGVQDAQKYLRGASKRAPGGFLASTVAPTLRPRDSQEASGKRLRRRPGGALEPKSAQEPPRTSPDHKFGPPDIDLGPLFDATLKLKTIFNRFGNPFRSFWRLLPNDE